MNGMNVSDCIILLAETENKTSYHIAGLRLVMATDYQRLYKNHLLEQAIAYLAAGVVISISDHFHNYQMVFFGHLLISASFILSISINLPDKWIRRVASSLDIFSGAAFLIAFIDIIIFLLDQLK